MNIPTPRRVLVVTWTLLRGRVIQFLSQRHSLTVLPRFFDFWSMMRKLRDALVPDEPVVLFWWRANRERRRMESAQYRLAVKRNDIIFEGTSLIDEARKSGRPIFYVNWHHGARYIELSLFAVDKNVIAPTVGDFDHPRMFFVDYKNTAPAFIRLARALESGGNVVVSYDAQVGRLNLPIELFGYQWFVASGYPRLVQQYQPMIIPVTHYMTANRKVIISCNTPLFTDRDVSQMTSQDIVEQTTNYFVEHLKRTAPHQVNYRWFFEQLIR